MQSVGKHIAFPEIKVGEGIASAVFTDFKASRKAKRTVWIWSAQGIHVFYWYKCKFEASIDLKDYPLLPV